METVLGILFSYPVPQTSAGDFSCWTRRLRARSFRARSARGKGGPSAVLVGACPADRAVTPWRVPAIAVGKRLGNPVDAMRAPRAAARDAKQAHPAAGPETMAGYRLVGIFRAGRQVPAGVADEARQGQLVQPHNRGHQESGPVSLATGRTSCGIARAFWRDHWFRAAWAKDDGPCCLMQVCAGACSTAVNGDVREAPAHPAKMDRGERGDVRGIGPVGSGSRHAAERWRGGARRRRYPGTRSWQFSFPAQH